MHWTDIARNKNVSVFSEATGISVATLRDWNKRGLAKGIGQAGPNGHWLYSKTDVAKVAIASIFNGNGIGWRASLVAGVAMGEHLEARAHHPDENYYKYNNFAFFGIEHSLVTYWGAGETYEDAIQNADKNSGVDSVLKPVAFVADLRQISNLIPIGTEINYAEFDS